MRDRYSGKSRGFGFVTFYTVGDAQRVAGAEHVVDGRRCDAKLALPRGGSAATPSGTAGEASHLPDHNAHHGPCILITVNNLEAEKYVRPVIVSESLPHLGAQKLG